MNTMIRSGSVLIYTLIMTTVAAMIFAGIMQFVLSQVRASLRAEPREQALHIAESGVHFYRWYIAHNVEGKTASQVRAFWEADPLGVDDDGNGMCDDVESGADPDDSGTQAHIVEYQGIGFYSICVTPPSEYSTELFVTAQGWTNKNPNVRRTIRARLRKPSWSEFAVMGNKATYLNSGTEVFGPMHFNGGIEFDGVAHNVVSSSVADYIDPDFGKWRKGVWTNEGTNDTAMNDEILPGPNKVFIAGTRFPVEEQDFNLTGDFAAMKSTAEDNALFFPYAFEGRHIILKGDVMDIKTVKTSGPTWYTITDHVTDPLYTENDVPIPDEGVLYVDNNVWIEGHIGEGKRLTIAAHSTSGRSPSIYLGEWDITYDSYDGDTVLGLVAENNIRIMRSSKDDLRIDAAMIAQGGRIGIEDYTYLRNKITTYGALISNGRVGFGWTTGDSVTSGYAKRSLIFDSNLLYAAPPLFPTGSAYTIDLWEEL